MQETLQDRLQREAREKLHGWTVNVLEHQIERDYILREIDQIISHTISETIKAGVSVIEGEKKETDNLVPLDNYEHPEYDQAVGFNQALQTAVTKLTELQDKK